MLSMNEWMILQAPASFNLSFLILACLLLITTKMTTNSLVGKEKDSALTLFLAYR